MGLMEAMRYLDDYDGVIAGAPYMGNHTQLWEEILNAYVPPDVVAKVDVAVLATCDALRATAKETPSIDTAASWPRAAASREC